MIESRNSTTSAYILLKYRILNYLYKNYTAKIAAVVALLFKPIDIGMQCNCQISYKARIGVGLKLPHKADGVIISQHAIIGDNVTIYHGVTIGVHPRYPHVKVNDNCVIGPNTVIISTEIAKNTYIRGASFVDWET